MRLRTIIDDLPIQRRMLARGALMCANALTAWNRPKAGGTGTLLVSYANLGDQLRMLNVLSRYADAGDIDIVCNSGTEQAFQLFPLTRAVRSFQAQGALGLVAAASSLLTSRSDYARAIVPQPFVTQPLAVAYAVGHASRIEVLADNATQTNSIEYYALTRDSWRAAYEDFFSAVYGRKAVSDRPRIREDLAFRTYRSKTVVLHLAASVAAKTIAAGTRTAIACLLMELGYDVVALGSESERAALQILFKDLSIELWCGRRLEEIAELMACARLFIGVDSSMMHLADAVGTPSIILYLATAPQITGPFYSQSIAITPDHYEPLPVQTLTSWTASVTSDIRPDAILEAIRRVLPGRSAAET